jgi:hypothetical protein
MNAYTHTHTHTHTHTQAVACTVSSFTAAADLALSMPGRSVADQAAPALASAEELARRAANIAGIAVETGAKLAGMIGAGKDEALVCACLLLCVCVVFGFVCACVGAVA